MSRFSANTSHQDTGKGIGSIEARVSQTPGEELYCDFGRHRRHITATFCILYSDVDSFIPHSVS